MSANKKHKAKARTKQPAKEQLVAQPSNSVSKYAIVAVLLLTGAIYVAALQNGIVHIDDDMYLLKNPYLRDFSFNGIRKIFTSFYEFNYHPLTTLTFLIEYNLFAFNPMPYHLFNLLLHLVNTWLVYRLAKELSTKPQVGVIVALLFAIHPMHVESVAWISERKGLLCAFFFFLSLRYYVQYLDNGMRKKHLVGAGLCFLGACLSKSAAVTLPVLLLLFDWYRGRKNSAGMYLEKLPFFAVSLLFGVLAIMSQRAGGALNDITTDYGLLNRIFLFIGGLAFYFERLVIPYPLAPIHYFPNVVNGALPWLFYASVPFLLSVFWLINRKSQGQREARFGALFFLIVISVMLQLITVGAAYASERYTYVSYFGLFYAIAQVYTLLQGNARTIALWGGGVLLVVFYVITGARVPVWATTESIFSDIIEKNPDNGHNYLVYTYWGDYHMYNKRPNEAINEYNRAIEVNPDYVKAYIKRGEAHEATGSPVYAILDYNDAIKRKPGSAIAYNNRGWAYFNIGDKILARASLDTAISLDSTMAVAYNNRGWVRLNAQDTTGAVADFNTAIRRSELFTKPLYNRAMVSVFKEEYDDAISDYGKLIEINPQDGLAYFSRGIVYIRKTDTAGAVEDFRRASELGNRDAADALKSLGRK